MARRRPTALARAPGAVAVGAVAVAAVLVAEGAVWLLRPSGAAISPATVAEGAYFSAAELRRAADFRDVQRLIGLGALGVQGAVLVTLAVWRPPALRRALARASRRPLLGGAAVGAGIALALVVVAVPLEALAHSRSRDVGLSTQDFGAWLGDRGRAAGVAGLLAALAGAVAVALVRGLGRRFWLGAAAVAVAGAVVLIWLAPVLLAPLFNRFEPLPEGRARAEVLTLAERAGVDVGEVYRVDASRRSTALNAYVSGVGTTKRVVIYDNALRGLEPGELRSVVAHELAHVDERDVLRGLAFVALVAPLGMLFVQLAAGALARRRGDDLGAPSGVPALALAAAAAAFVLGVPGNQLSRAVEAQADTYALELTGDPDALIALQRRLAIANVADPSPPRLLHAVFGTHPTTIERIGAAVAFRREREPAVEPESTKFVR